MAFCKDTYCQLFERFITEEQWNYRLYSSRSLHREVNGFRPASFLQRKLTRNEGSILEKALWVMFFGSVHVLPVYGFLKTFIMMVTNMKNYLTLDDDDDDADFKKREII